MRLKALYIATAILCVAGCSKSSGSGATGTTGGTTGDNSGGNYGANPQDPAPTTSNTVNVNPALDYNPAQLTVAVGSTVSFVFGSVGHTVSFVTAGSPASIPLTSNATVTRTFPTAGSYSYYCQIHAYMQGTITVQ